ncbi:hypothetical protein A33I_20275 [Alkalihalophilus marmarensis DSM 21297]|uniref:Uncharacterized protein n=2 Tax=Alkalihalophilus TaxID=2893060 RepID=U6SIG3_9BACI|nr:hypothetical protein A33I_20275 [Alkalihalophilus marmarensis DSM 21297]
MIVVSGYFLLKFSQPLELDDIASSEDNKSVIIGIGNNGFRDVVIIDISVNNNEKPLETRLQDSDELKGFIITDDFNADEAIKYSFSNIDVVVIKLRDDKIYGVSVIHNEKINNVHIEYSHFGMTYNDTVYINNY